jgi:small subunit ribosomal protein S5e
MMHGRNNGKKNMAIAIVRETLDIIALLTNKNPIETILEAVSKAGPREDSQRVGITTHNINRIWRCC